MHTVPYKQVLWQAARLLGLDPAVNLLPGTAATLTDYINLAISIGWRYYPWPDIQRYERRFWRPLWNASTSYATGDEVVVLVDDTPLYYVALQDSVGVAVTDQDYWQETQTLNNALEYEQTGLTPIDTVYGAWTQDPRTSGFAEPLRWSEVARRLEFGPGPLPSSVWLLFSQAPYSYTHETWESLTAYSPGNLVLASDGIVYQALQTGAGYDPVTETDYWAAVPFPQFLAAYAARAAFADSLSEDGQTARGDREMDRAWALLEQQMARLSITQHQTARFGVRTH